jgi:hypothetical protein
MRDGLRRWPFGRRHLEVASGNETRDAAEQAPQPTLGQATLQTRAAVAPREATGPKERAEHPFGRDGSAVAQLQDLVGGDTDDRGQERRSERGRSDLVDAESERDEDGASSDPPRCRRCRRLCRALPISPRNRISPCPAARTPRLRSQWRGHRLGTSAPHARWLVNRADHETDIVRAAGSKIIR